MKFTIDRSKWRCGGQGSMRRGKGPTALCNDEGFMCCLGQASLQLGCKIEHIKHRWAPHSVCVRPDGYQLLAREGLTGAVFNTEFSNRAMEINDCSALTDADREKLLREEFAACGHELDFFGEYATAQ